MFTVTCSDALPAFTQAHDIERQAHTIIEAELYVACCSLASTRVSNGVGQAGMSGCLSLVKVASYGSEGTRTVIARTTRQDSCWLDLAGEVLL